jgi:hypothetical protein
MEKTMDRRKFVVGSGAAALAVAGLTVHRAVDAQDATPTPANGTATPGSTTTQMQTAYQAFVAALAANLSISDASTVDTAIRTTLKQLVDEQYTAGHISADEANALKQAIDTAQAPLPIGAFARFAERGGIGGFPGGRGGRRGRRGEVGGWGDGKNKGGMGGNYPAGGTNQTPATPTTTTSA